MSKLLPRKTIPGQILIVRGHKVILDSDLARIYGVTTKRLNEQVRRNRTKFPSDFGFQLSKAELQNLRSQLATSSSEPSEGQRHGGRRYLPYVFSEHGCLQAANVLNSARATAMSIYVIRAFIKLREQQAANETILKRLAEIDKTLLTHDAALRDIYPKLLPLLAPPPDPEHREIGFHIKEGEVPYQIRRQKQPPLSVPYA